MPQLDDLLHRSRHRRFSLSLSLSVAEIAPPPCSHALPPAAPATPLPDDLLRQSRHRRFSLPPSPSPSLSHKSTISLSLAEIDDLKRTDQVANELPEKIERLVRCEASAYQELLMKRVEDNLGSLGLSKLVHHKASYRNYLRDISVGLKGSITFKGTIWV